MQLSVEVVDHIFSFLVSERETLVACSEDPVLFPIVERHLYHQITVSIPYGTSNGFEPGRLIKFVSENPRILNYVRILESKTRILYPPNSVKKYFDDLAKILLLFPQLVFKKYGVGLMIFKLH